MTEAAKTHLKNSMSSDDMGQQIDALRDDLAKLTATIRGDVSAGIETAGHQISQTGRDAQASALHMVRANPLAAVGIAAGLGLLLGMMSRKA